MHMKLRNIIFILVFLLSGCTLPSVAKPTRVVHEVTQPPLPIQKATLPMPAAEVTMTSSLPTAARTLIPAGTPFLLPIVAISAENVNQLGPVARFGRGNLTDLAWSSDGKLIAAASSTGIQVYDAKTLLVKFLIETDYKVEAVAFSPDSTLIASGGDPTGIVHLWSAVNGIHLNELPDNNGDNIAIRFSPKGDMLLSVSYYAGEMRLWRLSDGKLLETLKYSGGVDFSPDGNYLAVGGIDKFAILNLPDGNILRTVKIEGEKSQQRIATIAYAPDGATLATLQESGDLNLWNVSDGTHIRLLTKVENGLAKVSSMHFSPDGKLIALDTHYEGKTVGLLRVSDGEMLQEFSAGAYASLVFSPAGDQLAIGTQGHAIQLWNVADGEPIMGLEDATGRISGVAYSADGKLLAAYSKGEGFRLWQVSNGALKVLNETKASSLVFSPTENRIVTGSLGPSARLSVRQVPDDSFVEGIVETSSINSLAFSSDGAMLAEGFKEDGSIQIRQAKDLKLIRTLKGKKGQAETVNSLAFSPDGKLLASGSADTIIRIWQVSDGKLLFSLTGHTKEILSLVFSPKEPLLASTASDGTVRLWQAATGERLRTIYIGTAYSLAFSSDGKLLAGGAGSSSVNLWQIEDGKLLRTLKFSNVTDDIRSVAFSPDGKLLAAGSDDQTVWLFGLPIP